jgi:NTP pyrophosphatase (non-canonical NTP hydrolase)
MRFPEPTSPTNNQKLEEEIGDLMGMIGILIDKGIVDSTNVTEAMRNKKAKLKKWSTIFETKQD